jgi:tetratricopeptide (TPR) repeat protein
LALLHHELPAAIGYFRRWAAADPHDRARLYVLGDALIKFGDAAEGNRYLQAAREHLALHKLIEQASTRDGRQNLGLLKDLGAAYQRVGLVPESKAWFKLALARDPTDPDVQAALYHLGAAATTMEEPHPGQPAHAFQGKRDGSGRPSG